MGNQTVNYLSLDIEGAEIQVYLRTHLDSCKSHLKKGRQKSYSFAQDLLLNIYLQVLETLPWKLLDIEVE